MPIPVSMFVPVKTPSLTNQREHWTVRKRRAADHRLATKVAWAQMVHGSRLEGRVVDFPLEVVLTRVASRELDDDNLRGALKHVRDGLAELLGVDDRDPRVRWQYAQEKAPRGSTPGVRATIGEVSKLCPTCGQKRSAA